MRCSAIELRRYLRSSAILSIVSFKRIFAESENWKGTMLPIGGYKFRNLSSLYFDTYDAKDTCAFAGDTS